MTRSKFFEKPYAWRPDSEVIKISTRRFLMK
jgi:hypothetical protein